MMNYLRPIFNNLSSLFILLIMISCHGPESLDLTNLENEVITFYNEPAEEINFPSMNIITDNNQEIVDDPKINAELIVIEDLSEYGPYKIQSSSSVNPPILTSKSSE